jgi:hypothetical protein
MTTTGKGGRGRNRSVALSDVDIVLFTISGQDFEQIYEMLVGKRAKESGVIYLENQTAKFRVAPERREWSVYGSPVG